MVAYMPVTIRAVRYGTLHATKQDPVWYYTVSIWFCTVTLYGKLQFHVFQHGQFQQRLLECQLPCVRVRLKGLQGQQRMKREVENQRTLAVQAADQGLKLSLQKTATELAKKQATAAADARRDGEQANLEAYARIRDDKKELAREARCTDRAALIVATVPRHDAYGITARTPYQTNRPAQIIHLLLQGGVPFRLRSPARMS